MSQRDAAESDKAPEIYDGSEHWHYEASPAFQIFRAAEEKVHGSRDSMQSQALAAADRDGAPYLVQTLFYGKTAGRA